MSGTGLDQLAEQLDAAIAGSEQDDAACEAAWLATLPPRRRRRRHDQPQAR